MRNAGLDEAQAGIKIAGRNINNLLNADDTDLMAESEDELKSLSKKVKEKSEKVGLKLNIQKTKIMASSPITSWQIVGETVETVADLIFLGSKFTADGDGSLEIKRRYSLEGKLYQPRQHMENQRHYFVNKGPSSQGFGFSNGHVWMWELDYKESWALKNWCFWTVVLEKTLESPLDCKEIPPVHLKEISPEYSLEGLMLNLKLQYSGHLMRRADSLEKTLMLGKIEGRRRGRQMMRWLDGIPDSMDMGFGWTPGVSDGQGGLACWGPWGCKELDRTEWLNWTDIWTDQLKSYFLLTLINNFLELLLQNREFPFWVRKALLLAINRVRVMTWLPLLLLSHFSRLRLCATP